MVRWMSLGPAMVGVCDGDGEDKSGGKKDDVTYATTKTYS